MNSIRQSELIPPAITDLHMHVIPDVDDGSTSMDMSMEMLRTAYDQGVTTVFATPHGDTFYEKYWGDYARKQFDLLKKRCREELPDLNLYLGAEIYMKPQYMEEILELLANGNLPTMNSSRYVLTEFSQREFPFAEMIYCLEKLIRAGYIPLLAHVERYHKTIKNLDNVKKIRSMGCRMQVNAYSIKEETNESVRAFARELIREKLIDGIGSDAHRMNHRPPRIEEGVREMYEILGEGENDYIEKVLGGFLANETKVSHGDTSP